MAKLGGMLRVLVETVGKLLMLMLLLLLLIVVVVSGHLSLKVLKFQVVFNKDSWEGVFHKDSVVSMLLLTRRGV